MFYFFLFYTGYQTGKKLTGTDQNRPDCVSHAQLQQLDVPQKSDLEMSITKGHLPGLKTGIIFGGVECLQVLIPPF